MKRLFSIALCAAAVSAFGDTTASLGKVGVTKIVSKLTNTIVAVSYDDLAGGSGIVLSNFVKTANLTVGDQLAVFRGTGTYDTWVLKLNGEVKYWEKQDKTFTVGADGELTVGEGNAASGVTEAVGTGIWLVRKNPIDEKGDAIPFYIYGKPSTAKTVTTKPNAWNLVGNPTQGNVTITKEIIPAANNDMILVPAEKGLVTYIYKKNASDGNGGKGAWRRAAGADGQLGPAPTIEGGMGFWIKTVGAVDIKW